MKRWKEVVSKKRWLALLLTVVLAVPSVNGVIVKADNNGTESPTETVTESVKQPILSKTKKWDFESESQLSDFSLYQSAENKFTIQNGVLTPNGKSGESKAILNTDIENVKSISVDIIPGDSGNIEAGMYVGASNTGSSVDEINALAFLVDSNFTGWADAPNRTDIIVREFPEVTELNRVISETGKSNALFKNGQKEPINLKLDFEENAVVVTLSLVSNPAKCVQFMYETDSQMFEGKIGLRANSTDIKYDNLTITYESTLPKTATYDFENVSQESDFTFYQSGTSNFSVQNGVLAPNGTNGEMKAVLNADIKELKSVSVDIKPGTSGLINGGLYIGASGVGNAQDEIDALAFLVQSDFSGWSGAENRTDLIAARFPWQELHREVVEGDGAFFANGNKEPLNLKVDFGTNTVTVTLSLVSNPDKYIQRTYTIDSEEFDGKIGFRAQHSDVCFDNLKVQYKYGAETDTWDFAENSQGHDFTYYQSGESSFSVKDGVLSPNGTIGEMKAILNADIENLKSVSVDIKPGASGLINGGLYIGATGIGNAQDEIDSLAFLVQSDFSGWNGAENRTDLITARFPWQELHREVVEGDGAFFANGNREPLNLKVDFGTDTVTVTLSLVSNPDKFIQKSYNIDSEEFNGKIGLRAAHSDVNFDNLKIEYVEPVGSKVTYCNEGYNFSSDERVWQAMQPLNATPSTLEAWVKIPEAVADEKTGMIVSNMDNQPTFSMEMYTNGQPSLYWQADNKEAVRFTANVDLRTGEWTHVAFVCDVDADKVICYINGKVVYTKENAGLEDITTPQNISPLQHFYIGNANDGLSSQKLLGSIADVRIWDKTLSDTEISHSMMTQYTSAKDGLLFNVPLNKIENNIFSDLSGKENHLEIYERELNWINDNSEAGAYSIVVIPDQQIMTNYYPDMLNQLYQWIADNAKKENIQMVMNLGDIVDNCGSITQWDRAKAAYEILPDDLPFIAVPGNHDYDKNSDWDTGVSNRNGLTLMNQYFPMSLFESYSTESGSFSEDNGLEDNVANTWQAFEIYGNKYMIVALEYNPADDVLSWANDVVSAHKDHQVIVITHQNMDFDGTLTGVGAVTWEKFSSKHANVIMVLSGHIGADNIVRRTDKGEQGNDVVQMLLDAQMLDSEFGGYGILGIMRFNAEGTECKVSWYSPSRDKCLNECNQFTITLPEQNQGTVDKTPLREVIEKAEKLEKDDYKATSWEAFTKVLNRAKEVLEDDTVKQGTALSTVDKLEQAIDELVPLGEKEEEVTYTFTDTKEAEDFAFYHSSNGGFAVQDGKLVPTGEAGEFKAVIEKNAREYKSISVDIIPSENGGINAGVYIGASNANHPVDQIDALSIGIESQFTGWDDAANRVDLVVGSFPVWKELSRTISETGNNNALFTNGEKKPLNLKVDIDGAIVTITLSLKENPSTYIQTVYQYTGEDELAAGYVGLRSAFNNSSFDNLYLLYDQYTDKTELKELVVEIEALEQDGYSDKTWNALQDALKAAKKVLNDENATQEEVEAAIKALEDAKAGLKLSDTYKKVIYDFEDLKDVLDFDFYHSSNDGFAIKDGKLVTSDASGELKAILRGTNRAYKSVSVDIYPDKDGNINSGLYIHAARFGHAQDKGHALSIGIESNFTGWEDAANRVDIVVGSFPEWKELSRTISETGNGNALFTDGKKEPLNLKVDIKEKEVTITVSLLSNPDVFVQSVYSYTGDGNLTHGRVGIRSINAANSFDNLEAAYKTEVYSEEEISGPITQDMDTGSNNTNVKDKDLNNSSVNTGDNLGMTMTVAMLLMSLGTVLFLLSKKKRNYRCN